MVILHLLHGGYFGNNCQWLFRLRKISQRFRLNQELEIQTYQLLRAEDV
jgi:hypothetical protein